MAHDDDKTDANATLSALYRQLADEQAPERLNRTVLRLARHKPAPGSWLSSSWRAPAAFAATAVLAFAVILQLEDRASVEVPPEVGAPAAEIAVPRSVFEGAATETVRQLREIDQEQMTTSPAPGIPDTAGIDPRALDAGSLLPDEERCSDQARAQTRSWWHCIQDLEKRGLTQAAERELQALMRTFPQFMAPR